MALLLIPAATASFITYTLPDNTAVILNRSSSDYKTYTIKSLSNENQLIYPTETKEPSVKKTSSKRRSFVENKIPDGSVVKELPETLISKGTSRKSLAYKSSASSNTANLYNNVLNIFINEKRSGSATSLEWRYKYDGVNWGNSNYFEHYVIYNQEDGAVKSDNLTIINSCNNPNGAGTATCTLSYKNMTINRIITLSPGDKRYFQIKYSITTTSDKTDLRFFQIIDFDVPDTGSQSQCDDQARYNSLNDYVVVEDNNYFKNGFSADIQSSRHGIAYFSEELQNDWTDHELNNNDDCSDGVCRQSSCTDPAVALQYNLGDMDAEEKKEITFTFWFGQPTGFLTKEVSIYPSANFDQQTKQLDINAYIYDNNEGEKITSGTVNYYVYDSSDVQKKSGSW